MHIDQSKKEIFSYLEVVLNLLNSKSLLLNPNNTESLRQALCSILKDNQSTDKIRKNLMMSAMMISEVAENKWHKLDK